MGLYTWRGCFVRERVGTVVEAGPFDALIPIRLEGLRAKQSKHRQCKIEDYHHRYRQVNDDLVQQAE